MVALQKARKRRPRTGDGRSVPPRTIAQQMGTQLQEACAPFQYALSTRAGAEALTRALRFATESHHLTTVVSMDGGRRAGSVRARMASSDPGASSAAGNTWRACESSPMRTLAHARSRRSAASVSSDLGGESSAKGRCLAFSTRTLHWPRWKAYARSSSSSRPRGPCRCASNMPGIRRKSFHANPCAIAAGQA